MIYRFIGLRREGIAWHLSFNRPERRNALNHAMMVEIGHAVDRVAADRKARALVLRGNGGAFCAGGDLGSMSDMPKKPAVGADPLAKHYREYGALCGRASPNTRFNQICRVYALSLGDTRNPDADQPERGPIDLARKQL